MNKLIVLITLILSFNSIDAQNCSDTTIYANSKQTKFDKRFNDIKKIKSVPKYSGGTKKLEKYIQDNLVVIPQFKNEIFNLNYQIIISCEGKIIDVRTLGDKRFGEITNIKEIILKTENEWKPAKSNGNSVNCIYFDRMFINGSYYQQ